MGSSNFFGNSTEDCSRVVITGGFRTDLRFRDSPVCNYQSGFNAYVSVVSAIENLLSRNVKIKLDLNAKLQQMFGGYLFQGKNLGFETDLKQKVFITNFEPVKNFESIVDHLENGYPCVIKIEINEGFEFQNVNASSYPPSYCFCISGYLPETDCLVLKDIRGVNHGDQGYVYVDRENFSKANWISFVVLGVSHACT